MLPYNSSDVQEDLDYYFQLREYLAEGIGNWIKRFKGDTYGRYADKSLLNLLQEFQSFGRDYFDYVFMSLQKNTSQEPNPKMKIRRDMYRAISNLQNEWDIISRACNQRENTLYRKKINDAEEWVAKYYSRYKGYKVEADGETITPIIYFGKLYRITRYSFTPYPLISIPLNSISPIVWQGGFAHELGHHLYWNSAPISYSEKAKNIRQSLKECVQNTLSDFGENSPHELSEKQIGNLQSSWLNWFEETFADIVGTLLVGSQFLVSGLRIVDERSSTNKELLVDDREHALPAIRSFISLRTIANLPGFEETHQFKSLHEECEKRISNVLQRPHELAEDDFITVEVLRDSVDVVVKAIINGSWINKDGDEVPLISLFDVSAWQTATISTLLEKSLHPSAASMNEVISTRSSSKSFKLLLESLNKSEDEMYEALLELDIGVDDLAILSGCFTLTGNGGWSPGC